MIAGLVGAWKSKAPRHWQARALAALPWLIAVLGLFSTINYGIRHILIVYPIGAVGAACGLIWLIEKYKVRTQQLIAGSLLIAQLVIAGIAYPNYLPYFNILAGDEPGEILNDSDMDWGQGLFELSDYCKENKIDTLWLSYQGLMNTCWYPDLPPIKVLPKDTVVSGWVAVTEMHYRGVFHGQQFFSTPECQFMGFTFEPTPDFSPHKRFRWLDKHNLKAKVAGGSIRLYHVTNEANSQALRQE